MLRAMSTFVFNGKRFYVGEEFSPADPVQARKLVERGLAELVRAKRIGGSAKPARH